MSKKEIKSKHKFNKLTQGVKTGLAAIGMISFFPSLVQASQVEILSPEQTVQPVINQDMNSIPETVLHFQGGVPPGVAPLQNQYCSPPPYYNNQGWQQQRYNPYQHSYWHGAGYYSQYTYPPTNRFTQPYSAQYTYSVAPGRYSYQRPQFQPQARVRPQPPPYMILSPPPVNNGGSRGGGNRGGGGGGNSGGS